MSILLNVLSAAANVVSMTAISSGSSNIASCGAQDAVPEHEILTSPCPILSKSSAAIELTTTPIHSTHVKSPAATKPSGTYAILPPASISTSSSDGPTIVTAFPSVGPSIPTDGCINIESANPNIVLENVSRPLMSRIEGTSADGTHRSSRDQEEFTDKFGNVSRPLMSRIEGTSADGTRRSSRDQEEFTDKFGKELDVSFKKIEAHIRVEQGDANIELITVYPMSGKVVWKGEDGIIRTTRLLTTENGVPTCLQALRDIYAKDEKAGWKVSDWPKFSELTKGSNNGPKSLDRSGNHRLGNGFNCSAKDKTAAVEKALKDPTKAINIQANVYRAQRLKDHLVDLYEKKSKEMKDLADKEKDPTISQNQYKVAENLEDKADYFRGTTASGEKSSEPFDWDAVHLALLNPIETGGSDHKAIVSKTVGFKKEVAAKIETYSTDKPLRDGLGVVVDVLDAVVPPVAFLVNGAASLIAHAAGVDRTDRKMTSSDENMAVDIAILGIENEDLHKQRLLTVQCYEALGVNETKLRRDPAEFMVIKLLAVMKRSGDEMNVKKNVREQVLEIEAVDQALCGGLESLPGTIGGDIQDSLVQFAVDMKKLEPLLRLKSDKDPEGIEIVEPKTAIALEAAFAARVSLPKVSGLPTA